MTVVNCFVFGVQYVCRLTGKANPRDGDFADFSAFADFFSVLPIFRISADFCSFELSHIREREMREKNAYKITLTEPQREMRKNGSQKISLTEPQLREPLNCEPHAQCTLSFR